LRAKTPSPARRAKVMATKMFFIFEMILFKSQLNFGRFWFLPAFCRLDFGSLSLFDNDFMSSSHPRHIQNFDEYFNLLGNGMIDEMA
jgi:hypothetical protein